MREREELKRLRRAVDRLLEAQREASDTASRALESGYTLESGGLDLEDDSRLLETSGRLEAALADIRDILVGASEDVQTILEEGGDR